MSHDPTETASPALPHAVARLRARCLADDEGQTDRPLFPHRPHQAFGPLGPLGPIRPRLDRGEPRVLRCAGCRLIPSHCMCHLRPVLREPPQGRLRPAAVCLIMAPFEALKPSNTGWLIADVLPETHAFAWSRVQVEPGLLALLADPQWQPYLVFPGEFAQGRQVLSEPEPAAAGGAAPAKRPLFVLLDGTWSEACKMFRKSPYLAELPVLSLQPEQLSRYRLRRSHHEHHFCTSEVAALCLALAGDEAAAQTLEAYLDVFSNRYLRAKQSLPADEGDEGHQRLRALAAEQTGRA